MLIVPGVSRASTFRPGCLVAAMATTTLPLVPRTWPAATSSSPRLHLQLQEVRRRRQSSLHRGALTSAPSVPAHWAWHTPTGSCAGLDRIPNCLAFILKDSCFSDSSRMSTFVRNLSTRSRGYAVTRKPVTPMISFSLKR